ncbi:hypothetical protein [Helicobacter sp.]|uniref:hypothetical protein n=1 Tax=Helicobacter sp. TaxID=218 RepID=UPI0025BE22D1|nr:hypothetical protein [Helicobacter sp.]MBR2495441.1 hypothetical protein [Helicobacter sp.]
MQSIYTQIKQVIKSSIKLCCPPPIRKSLSAYLYKKRRDREFARLCFARESTLPLAFLSHKYPHKTSAKETKARKIRVLFYNDWGNSWEALEPLALALSANPLFEVIVLAMPSRVQSSAFYDLNASVSTQSFAHKVQVQAILVQDMLDSGVDSALCESSLLHATKLTQWLESTLAQSSKPLCLIGFDAALNVSITPRDLAAHYCFTTRPYDSLRPESFSNYAIAQVSKLCYVEYGVYMFSACEQDISAYDPALLRYYDYLFCPTEFHAWLSSSRQSVPSLLHIITTGSAYFEAILAAHLGGHRIKQARTKPLRVLWTPRWAACDIHSTFLRYVDVLLEQARQGRFLLHFRPHPNMYDHLVVESKTLSKQRWWDIKESIERYGLWDTRPSIIESFGDCDVIISDTSSMLIYAFLSGKPVIYTQGHSTAEISAWALRVVQGVFITTTECELLQILEDLCSHLPQAFAPKAALRSYILQQNFYFPKYGASNAITQTLLQDMTESNFKE